MHAGKVPFRLKSRLLGPKSRISRKVGFSAENVPFHCWAKKGKYNRITIYSTGQLLLSSEDRYSVSIIEQSLNRETEKLSVIGPDRKGFKFLSTVFCEPTHIDLQ
jgi:hypothetical protein